MQDKRRARRRPLRYAAWIALGPDDRRACVLSDVSDSGARIEIDEPDDVPENFLLLLSNNGAARRACRVVWREQRQLGVRFEQRVAAYNVAMVPKPKPEAAAAEPTLAEAAER
jgi:hypothetical protein